MEHECVRYIHTKCDCAHMYVWILKSKGLFNEYNSDHEDNDNDD